MANREQRGNREKRKPKASKPKPASGPIAPFAQAAGISRPKESGTKKKRQQDLRPPFLRFICPATAP